MAKTTKRKMSRQDNVDWEELYNLVRYKVLGYDENQSLSKNMVLRLKGLLTNKYIENNSIKNTANYSYKVVLNTFKYCMPEIQKGLRSNTFKDETHRFNYVLKIVESNLNTVYMRMKNAKKVEETISNHDVSDAVDYVNTFKIKENNHNNKKFDDLW